MGVECVSIILSWTIAELHCGIFSILDCSPESKIFWIVRAAIFFFSFIVLLCLTTARKSAIHLAIKKNILATHLLWFPIQLCYMLSKCYYNIYIHIM